MSYRRDGQGEEQVPLPIEMVYNSTVDALESKDEDGYSIYFQNGNQHFNRIYFKYPPEWKTSNDGEMNLHMYMMYPHVMMYSIRYIRML